MRLHTKRLYLESQKESKGNQKVNICFVFCLIVNSFEKDIQNLEKLYSKNEITSILRNTKENISNEVCILVAKRYKIKPFFRYSL